MDLREYNSRMDAATKAYVKAGDVQRKAIAKAEKLSNAHARNLACNAATQAYAAATQDYGIEISLLSAERYL